jgi:Tfp pilus assembly protein PilW
MRRWLADEQGVTMVELLVATVLMAIVLVGVVNVFISGGRAGADANARLGAQQNARLALDRLEFEGRCATTATLVSSGAGIAFSIPAWCSHATGNVSWCVASGVLTRHATADCTGAGQPFVASITSATPFSLPTPASGSLPALAINLTADNSNDPRTAVRLTDLVTLRNATRAS